MELSLTDKITYIPPTIDPLSSDIIILRGKQNIYLYDVGNSPSSLAWLNSLDGKKSVILSHFHADHSANIKALEYDELYVGNQTFKSIGTGNVVTAPITIEDGMKLDIIPTPSSHSKGALLLMVNDTYLFTGDSTYPSSKNDLPMYNVSLLNEQIKLLSSLPAKMYYLSHRNQGFLKKELIIRHLSNIYSKRKSGEAYITLPGGR